jgi:hypothetical protein
VGYGSGFERSDGVGHGECVERIGQEWGVLGVLVNNAVQMSGAGPSRQPFEDVAFQEWETVLRANRQVTGEVVRFTGGR